MTAPLRLVANCDTAPRCLTCMDLGELDDGFCGCKTGADLHAAMFAPDVHNEYPDGA